MPLFCQIQVDVTLPPVYANMDLYRAGGYDDGSDGIPPAVFDRTVGELTEMLGAKDKLDVMAPMIHQFLDRSIGLK